MDRERMEEEQQLNSCRELIQSNIMLYEKQSEEFHKKVEELYRAVQGGDVELYNQLMVSIGLEEHSKNQLRKNIAALKQPYFGRIDYQNISQDSVEKVYIGKNGVSKNKTEVIIADWRAPISTVYYENELGKGGYFLPSGKEMEIDLHLKRTFDIAEEKLNGYYDSDVAANDDLLVKYLSQNKDVVLGDIISTIQKEQNEIIRATPFSNIIVQGVAGSGKTTVAMHRISYILYNYEERFTSNEFCIIGSNHILLSYITGGLPELDVPDIKQKRMDEMFVHLLGREWRKSYKVREAEEASGWKSRLSFSKRLEGYLQGMKDCILPEESILDKTLGVVISKESIMSTVRENRNLPLYKLLKLMDQRLKARIEFTMRESDPDERKKLLSQKNKQYRNYYSEKMPAQSVVEIYENFLIQYRNCFPGATDTLCSIKEKIFDVYDLASLLLIKRRITQKKEEEEFGQVIIDEAQDFGAAVYYSLRMYLPDCYFTIMGDVSQNIHYETGMNDWDDICRSIFHDTKDQFRLLSKSYRNTVEISEYAGKILEKASAGRYKITPVIRHGAPVHIQSCSSKRKSFETILKIIKEIQNQSYDTVAVICRNEQEAGEAETELAKEIPVENGRENGFQKGVMVLPIHLTKGLEFDTAILWNTEIEQEEIEPATAKLLYVAATRALHELHIVNVCGCVQ